MAVSLKKPSKVDLSKPVLPRQLPEYTSVHLIDEEETIKNSSSATSIPHAHDIVTVSEEPNFLDHKNDFKHHGLNPLFIVVSVSLVWAFILFLVIFFLENHSAHTSNDVSSAYISLVSSSEVTVENIDVSAAPSSEIVAENIDVSVDNSLFKVFSIFSETLNYLFHNRVICILLSLFLVFSLFSLIRRCFTN